MFIPIETCAYPTYQALFGNAARTGRAPGDRGSKQIIERHNPGDRLMYTQSNGHMLIGQDSDGSLHLAGTPSDRDYPLPCLCARKDQRMHGHPGMFYQADLAMLLGRLHFDLTLEDGRSLSTRGDDSESFYLDAFLPATTRAAEGLALTAMSLAPVLERSMPSAIKGLPLPGPCGALHTLHIQSHSSQDIAARANLRLSPCFVTQFEDNGTAIEERFKQPYRAEWDGNMLVLWRPDACAAVHAMDFSARGDPGDPELFQDILIPAGGSVALTCYVAVTVSMDRISPALATLYTFSMLEWINIASRFWQGRLGTLATGKGSPLERESADFVRRSVLDNFNCLQMNARGELTAHWQGAPAHQFGRLWGVDAEPTAVSVLYALPELGPVILRYIAFRNKPHYRFYRDHSAPNLAAPLIIAAKYAELTGDAAFFGNEPELLAALRETAEELLCLRHPCGLVHSRYSSDGHVFNKYDHGANVKAYRAFDGYAELLRRLGGDGSPYRRAALRIVEGIRAHMLQDGPFGEQIRGGANLGEHEAFYLADTLFYYDGEDSASCLGPLYGAYGHDWEPWRNYHRFARSLFATNYDPELGALRWFAWGGPIDGTALVSAAGGAVTREEMCAGLENMLALGCDETGSLFWWSKARNSVRWLTRCSQGQGMWVYQHTEQWLGLRLDAFERRLVVCPQGLYSAYDWRGARLGAFRFDIGWEEAEDSAVCRVGNHNAEAFTLCVRARERGAGLGEAFAEASRMILPGETAEIKLAYPESARGKPPGVWETESSLLAGDGAALGVAGMELPWIEQKGVNVHVLRFAVVCGGQALKSASLRVTPPRGFRIKTKQPAMWELWSGGADDEATFDLGDMRPRSRAAASFYLENANNLWHSPWILNPPFVWPLRDGAAQMLLCGSESAELGVIEGVLTGTAERGSVYEKRTAIHVRGVAEKEFRDIAHALLGGFMAENPKHL
jgi:hypothetical protein